MKLPSTNVVRAFAIAPLGASLMFAAINVVRDILPGGGKSFFEPDSPISMTIGIVGLIILSLPISYTAAIFLGPLCYLLLKKLGYIRYSTLALAFAVVFVLPVPFLPLLGGMEDYGDPAKNALFWYLTVSACGLAVGMLFWLLGSFHEENKSGGKRRVLRDSLIGIALSLAVVGSLGWLSVFLTPRVSATGVVTQAYFSEPGAQGDRLVVVPAVISESGNFLLEFAGEPLVATAPALEVNMEVRSWQKGDGLATLSLGSRCTISGMVVGSRERPLSDYIDGESDSGRPIWEEVMVGKLQFQVVRVDRLDYVD